MRTWQHWGTIWWTRVQTKEGTNKTPNHFISDTAETGWRNKNWPEVNSSIDASTPSTRIIKRKLCWKPHFILLSTNNCIKKGSHRRRTRGMVFIPMIKRTEKQIFILYASFFLLEHVSIVSFTPGLPFFRSYGSVTFTCVFVMNYEMDE